jgi:hypothetical protein
MTSRATLTGRTWKLAAAAGLAGMTAVLTACGGSTAASVPPVTSAPSTPAPGSGSSSAPASGTPSASVTAQAGASVCLSSDLQARLGQSQGAAGTIYQVVEFTNTSNTTCTLYGYPGVSFVTGIGGKVIGAPATRNTAIGAVPVTLRPGGDASTLVGVEDVTALPASKCHTGKANWLQLYAPGDTGALYVQYSSEICTNSGQTFMTDGAVHPGSKGGA